MTQNKPHFRKILYKLRISLFLLVLGLLPSGASAQLNKLYTTQHGLVTSNMHSVTIDSRGLLWIASSANLGYFDGYSFNYLPNINPATGHPYYNIVNQICEDYDGFYWLLTDLGLYRFDSHRLHYDRIFLNKQAESERGFPTFRMLDVPSNPDEKLILTSGYGVYVLDVEKNEVKEAPTQRLQNAIGDAFVVSGVIDNANQLWGTTNSNKLIHIDIKTGKSLPVDLSPEAATLLATQPVNDIIEVPVYKSIYLASSDGVLRYDETTGRIDVLSETRGMPFTRLFFTGNGHLLAGTDSYGVWQLHRDGTANHYELQDQVFDLSLGKVRDMVQDDEGNLIIALHQKGLFIQPQHNDAFRYHAISLKGNGKNSSCITSVTIDKAKNYWIGTDGAGVFTTDGMHMATAHPVNEGLRSLLIQSVVLDNRQEVWAGSYGGGIQHYNSVLHRFETPQWLTSWQEQKVMAMTYSPLYDMLYAGTNGSGIAAIDLGQQRCEKLRLNSTIGDWITALYIDAEQTLWIGELGGVSYLNLRTGTSGSLPGNHQVRSPLCISSMGTGREKRILIGSANGLYIYNPADATMQHLLDGIDIQSINQTDGELWAASSNCIYAVDKKSFKVSNFSSLGGYFIGEFHRNASLNNGAGNILFGCDNGIVCFTPHNIQHDRKLNSDILFTSLRVGDRNVDFADSTVYLDANILDATRITLPHDQSTFSLSFAVPNYSSPLQIHYEYRLEGYETAWTPCQDGNAPRAYYSSLPSGHYRLVVRAFLEGAPDSQTERCIDVVVEFPWYNTTVAHLIYIIFLLLALYAAYRVWKARRLQRAALATALHNEEMKETKLRLFTSITHELRTPLTMIVSPMKQLLTSTTDETMLSNLNVMKHNCDRLLDIVRQITDIRRIDAGQFRLHFQEVELCEYVQDIARAFLGAASVKHINFSIESTESAISVWIDPLHFEKVVVNILSNAFKFCPEQGKILIRLSRMGENIELSIYNSGSHIDEADLLHIYERFYQSAGERSHAGSGIGLNLAYELTGLHHGTLTANNVEPQGVIFTISLPAGYKHLTASELEPRPKEEHPSQNEVSTALPITEEEQRSDAATASNDAATASCDTPTETDAANKKPSGSAAKDKKEGRKGSRAAQAGADPAEREVSKGPASSDIIATRVETIYTEAMAEGETSEETTSLPTVLVVDDSRDMCEYLRSQLSPHYNITLAFSGNSAWNIILQTRPDVIITDVKMPDGDGIELCQRVKSNPEFDHIPIIMLTGEGSESLQVESLRMHVDHYMQKPFNVTILRGIIQQVLGVRTNLKRHIQRHDITADLDGVEMASMEDQLYERINDAVHRHLDDDEFGVQQLASEVGISRVHLNRKMKEKYGMSPNVYIRSYRLKQAAYLLIKKHVNVSEVAYRVGFSTHSYFSSSFREFFGMSPKEFIAHYSAEENREAFRKIVEQ